MKNNKLICIVGPTASGKTGLGIQIAKKFNGEIVSADSRQVFRGLDIGTGKDLGEYGDVKYHLVDICDPGEDFSLFDWLERAKKAIDNIQGRGKLPIIVGGTGLYIQALIEGFRLKPENDKNPITNIKQKSKIKNQRKYTRKQLENMTVEKLQEIYYSLPTANYLLDKNNPHRLIRAIEKTQSGERASKSNPKYYVLQIGIFWPREELNKRIDMRVEQRLEEGMLEEVRKLLNQGVNYEWMQKIGLEYRVMSKYIVELEEIDFYQMKEELKIKIHQYAKRQMTWFKRFPEIKWIDKTDTDRAEKLVVQFIEPKN